MELFTQHCILQCYMAQPLPFPQICDPELRKNGFDAVLILNLLIFGLCWLDSVTFSMVELIHFPFIK